jgi:hypothetical protein
MTMTSGFGFLPVGWGMIAAIKKPSTFRLGQDIQDPMGTTAVE